MGISGKRILITGSSGFIGRVLRRELVNQGAVVFGLERGQSRRQSELAGQHSADLEDAPAVQRLVKAVAPDFVVHLAAVRGASANLADYGAAYRINLLGSLNLIEACEMCSGLQRFVFLGSCEEYGDLPPPFCEQAREVPVSAYAVTKLAVTQLLQSLWRAKRFPSIVLRPSVVYGPGQNTDMFLPALIWALVSGRRFAMSPGAQTRDFVHVDDVVTAIVGALRAENCGGRVINVSSSCPVRIADVAAQVAALVGPDALQRVDMGSLDYRAGESMNYWASNALAKECLGWRPQVPFDSGLEMTVAYFRGLVLERQ